MRRALSLLVAVVVGLAVPHVVLAARVTTIDVPGAVVTNVFGVSDSDAVVGFSFDGIAGHQRPGRGRRTVRQR